MRALAAAEGTGAHGSSVALAVPILPDVGGEGAPSVPASRVDVDPRHGATVRLRGDGG
jgi:hypothetical protein